MLKDVTWVDDVTCEYCEIVSGLLFGILCRITQAKKILIISPKRLIIINPVEDSNEQYIHKPKEKVLDVDHPESVSS